MKELREIFGVSGECASRHFGPWAIELDWFAHAIEAINAGVWTMRTPEELVAVTDDEEERERRTLNIVRNGIAVLSINGQMMKGGSKFSGTDTLRLRQKIRLAANNPRVNAIMLVIDSPGGVISGNDELAEDVRAAAAIKPVHAHIDDLGASAALWVATQATRVTASRTSQVGSIGTMGVVADSSERAKNEGIKIHVISTGVFKGAGTPGTVVTKEHLAELHGRVDAINEHFLTAIENGRGMTRKEVEAVADGRVFIAKDAREANLIDDVMSLDEAFDELSASIDTSRGSRRSARAAMAIRLNEAGIKIAMARGMPEAISACFRRGDRE